jgi:putative ABC transport system substrate-binding protein
MNRRNFIGSGLLAFPLFSTAQQPRKVPVVGVLNTGVGPRAPTVDNTRQGLRDLGYVEGKTIVLDVRFAGGKTDAFPALAADLVRRKVDILFVSGPAAVGAARDATSTIPIVALDLESDPIQAGFARSFAQPGGNMTGLFLDQPGLTGKWLGLIAEAAPTARRIAVLRDPTTGPWQLAAIQAAAVKLKVDLQVLEVRGPGELDQALEVGVNAGSRALVQLSSPIFDGYHKQIADLTTKYRLPAISMFRRFAESGGLMSYGLNQLEYAKRAATYIDRILKGAKPGDLAIEQPTKFNLILNLKTAKAFGLTLPQGLLLRADEVIQ